MDILILGGNGFIGSAAMAGLAAAGHRVTGLGRNMEAASRRFPEFRFVRADLSAMTRPEDWAALVGGHQAIVNCAGALQDGLRDDLDAVQQRAMVALYEAAAKAGDRLVVQVSARTGGDGAGLPFLSTKRNADAALKASGVDHVILRPALVVGRNAHGGTALIRALASFPFLIPATHEQARVETVALDDVTEAVVRTVSGEIPPGSDVALAAPETLTLGDVLARHRRWLGLPIARLVSVPPALARPATFLADLAGRLGWRSPLRSTAMAVMAGGVVARDPASDGPGFSLRSLDRTLSENPSGVQDLWFARLYLLKAPILVMLSAFWLASGLIPLGKLTAAMAHFDGVLNYHPALFTVLATCLVDIGLGLAVLFRPTAKHALWGMIAVSIVYLLAATVTNLSLWFDPLGPLVKVLPSIMLTLVALATLDER
ncbi:MAG: SDR family oxidoreductase [Hoeflea sp.]|uniref:SDR family oxidoreductase n=1 Tax=Hoeflea sp. TaxID=1940281 RepID=UPI0032EB3576